MNDISKEVREDTQELSYLHAASTLSSCIINKRIITKTMLFQSLKGLTSILGDIN